MCVPTKIYTLRNSLISLAISIGWKKDHVSNIFQNIFIGTVLNSPINSKYISQGRADRPKMLSVVETPPGDTANKFTPYSGLHLRPSLAPEQHLSKKNQILKLNETSLYGVYLKQITDLPSCNQT